MKELDIDLGCIGHKAGKLQGLFPSYSYEPNENGYFLRFDNYTYIGVNEGVTVWTNCFENKEHFYDALHTKLLFNF